MIDYDKLSISIVKSIKDALKVQVIRANQNAEPPKYPYIAYTITTLMKTNNGTYGEFTENINGENIIVYRKEFQQIWSFTVLSDNDLQSKELAFKLYDYLDKVGTINLVDKKIVVQQVGNITNRDNLLTVGYEYRNGFDVTFAFINEIEYADDEIIEHAIITESQFQAKP